MNSEISASQVVRFQDAQAMSSQKQLGMRGDAAAIAEMPVSTFRHRMAGRRSAEDYGKTRRLLTAEEESFCCGDETLQRSGWLQTPEDVRVLALEIVQRQNPDWTRQSLHKCHPEIKLPGVSSSIVFVHYVDQGEITRPSSYFLIMYAGAPLPTPPPPPVKISSHNLKQWLTVLFSSSSSPWWQSTILKQRICTIPMKLAL